MVLLRYRCEKQGVSRRMRLFLGESGEVWGKGTHYTNVYAAKASVFKA